MVGHDLSISDPLRYRGPRRESGRVRAEVRQTARSSEDGRRAATEGGGRILLEVTAPAGGMARVEGATTEEQGVVFLLAQHAAMYAPERALRRVHGRGQASGAPRCPRVHAPGCLTPWRPEPWAPIARRACFGERAADPVRSGRPAASPQPDSCRFPRTRAAAASGRDLSPGKCGLSAVIGRAPRTGRRAPRGRAP